MRAVIEEVAKKPVPALGAEEWLFAEIYNEDEFLRRKRHYMEIVKERI